MIRQNGEAGVALVEFALSIVLVLTLIFGIIDIGRAIFAYVWVANTARIGARYAMVTGAFCRYPDGTPCSANGTQLISYLQNNPQGINFTNSCPLATGTRGAVCIQSGCVSATAFAQLPCASGVQASVEVQYQFGFVCPFLPLPTWTMTSTSTRYVQ